MKKKISVVLVIALVFVLSVPFTVAAKTYAPAQVKIKSVKMSSYDCNTVVVKWSKVKKNVKGYQIYRSTKKNGKYKKVADIKASNTYWDLYTPEVGKTYYYKVRAYNNKNGKKYYGKWSSIKKITVKENGPAIDTIAGTYPFYNNDYGFATIHIKNYSKSKTVFIDTTLASINNHNNSSMDMYIDAYMYGDDVDVIDTSEGELIALPPGKTISLFLEPYSDQTIISFNDSPKNIQTVFLLVGYNNDGTNEYMYMWYKGLGGSLS